MYVKHKFYLLDQVYLEKSTSSRILGADAPPGKEQSLWIDRRWGTEDSGEGSNASDKRLLR